MKALKFTALTVTTLLAVGCAATLPEHTVEETSLGNAMRIQVNTNDPGLTKEDCGKLIENYRSEAGDGGQVSVHKPNPALQNALLPFCVDNMEGQGVQFNDIMFPS